MNNQEEYRCSFCGKSPEDKDVVCMIKGENACICDSCIRDALKASNSFILEKTIERTIRKVLTDE